MSEHFPDQDQMMFPDDSPLNSASDMSTPIREFTDKSDSVSRTKPLKPFNEVRRCLNFDEVDKEETDSEEIRSLKKAIAELEAEKEARLVQYKQSSDKVVQLEAEISKTREELSLVRYRQKLKQGFAMSKDTRRERAHNLKESCKNYKNDKYSKVDKCA